MRIGKTGNESPVERKLMLCHHGNRDHWGTRTFQKFASSSVNFSIKIFYFWCLGHSSDYVQQKLYESFNVCDRHKKIFPQ